MKLQNLILIFLAIAIPVILILSVYIGLQVDTVTTREKYADALINAAHEAMLAFQLNTTSEKYGDKQGNVADVKIRDIQGALNVFSSSLATSFGMTGATKKNTMAYIPALVFTLYDGYYIYSPTEAEWEVETEKTSGTIKIKEDGERKWEQIQTKHELKAYTHYVKEYVNGEKRLVINFTLDNFVSVYYYDKNRKEYESRAGHLEIIPVDSRKNAIIEENGGTEEVKKYYEDAWKFTKWFNDKLDKLGTDEVKEMKIEEIGTKKNSALPNEPSDFNSVKYDVIKNSITKNLIQSMYISGYEMPELRGEDWDLILNNVCLIAFMQGIPIGTTRYNDYTIAVSTENKETVRGTDFFFIGEGGQTDGRYHRIWCEYLKGDKIVGYYKTRFKANLDKKEDDLTQKLACYYCTVRASCAEIEYAKEYYDKMHPINYDLEKRVKAYYSTLIKEKLALVNYKQTGFISESRPIQGGDWE